MRTLLIASQKGGVGKTTTAINLAAIAGMSGQRTLVLDADPLGSVVASLHLAREAEDEEDRPASADPVTGNGAFWYQPSSNFDVVSPYPDDDTSETHLEEFLRKLPESSIAASYDLLVIDAPPMLGPRPKVLLRASDDVLIVQRAEPMSLRTLPSYLELLQNALREGAKVKLAGILLTLPNGTLPGGKAEQTLNERFPGMIPQSIPHDSEVNQALVVGKPLVEINPESLAAKRYFALANSLGFAAVTVPVLARVGTAVASRAESFVGEASISIPTMEKSRGFATVDTPSPANTPRMGAAVAGRTVTLGAGASSPKMEKLGGYAMADAPIAAVASRGGSPVTSKPMSFAGTTSIASPAKEKSIGFAAVSPPAAPRGGSSVASRPMSFGGGASGANLDGTPLNSQVQELLESISSSLTPTSVEVSLPDPDNLERDTLRIPELTTVQRLKENRLKMPQRPAASWYAMVLGIMLCSAAIGVLMAYLLK